MPLVRYELRSEHSMANPELFRSAARDDPEGLLEGVAMAGLVGIVRQLGDLAEFAAEVFRDLHEEFVSVGGRAHDLSVRVRTLEAELPAVEKSLLSEPNQLRFAYTNGADWHASIRSDQNHCTSGDLPRFVRKYYEECRGPPRLFLLDKYDGVGAGACLKRYSDPSFFKLEWASSELMKAQRAQRDKKARRDKKKGRRRKSGLPTPATTQIPARVRYGSATLEDLDTLSQLLAPTLKNEVDLSSSNQSGSNGRVTQTQSKSNLGPQTKGSEYPTQPTAVSPAPQAEGGISESLKPNAEDIEAMSPRIIREMENVGGSKIPKGTDMEDHVATPAVAPPSRDVEKMSRRADEMPLSGSSVVADRIIQLAGEGLEVAAVERVRGKPRGDAMHTGGEVPKLGNGTVSQSKLRNVSSKTSDEHRPKEDVTSSESRTPSSTVAGDAGPQEDPSRTNTGDVRGPGQLFGKAVRKSSVDAKEAHVIAARFSRQGSGKLSRGSSDLAARDSAEQHTGNGSQRQSIAERKNSADGGHGVDRQPEHNTYEAAAGDGQDSAPAHKKERSVSSASAGGDGGFHDGRPSRSEFFTSNMVDTSEVSRSMEERMNSPPRLPPFRIEEILVQREEPPLISSPCSSPGRDDIRPSMSMLSRMSYCSALSSISSPSEPDSPISPNSPSFNAIYSPPGSPSRVLGGMAESPPGMYMGPFSPAADPSGYRNYRSEIPRLSLSPRSRSASPPWADRGDFGSAPVRPPPPRPIVISMAESRGQDESRQEIRSLDSQPSHSTSPSLDLSKADSVIFQSNEEPGHVASSQDTAAVEVHAGAAGDSPDYLERVAHLEAAPEHSEGMRSPDADSEAGGSFRSNASSPRMRGPLRSSIPSSFDNLDSGTTQPPLSTGFVELGRAESDSMDVQSEGTTLRIDDAPPIPVGEDGASERRAADASSIAVPVQHAPSSSGQAMDAAVYSMFADGEESEPSSPSGSVIIKDTPSPGSRTSDDSESEPEAHDYYASSHGPVSPRSVAHALEDVIYRRESGSTHSSVHEDLIDESSDSAPTNGAASIQEDAGVVKSIAEHVVQAACIAPVERVEAFVSHTSVELDNSQEAMSSEDPTSALDTIEATTLRAIAVSTADVDLQMRSASISPPDTPPGKKANIAGEDDAHEEASASTLQWEGRSRPYESSESRVVAVAPASSSNSTSSATNSPASSPPPKMLLQYGSSLRWRGRPHPEQDFSLPPNLVCHTETSSPPYSPPPASDLESPRKWDEVSELSMSPDRSRAEVYPLPDSPAPLPESPVMSEAGDNASKRASDGDDEGATLEEVEMAETATDAELLPLENSLQVSDDVLPASEVQPKHSTFQYEFSSRPDLEVEHSQQSTLENEGNLDENYEAHDVLPASEVQPKQSTFQVSSRPDLEVEHSQQSTLENEGNLDEDLDEAHETPEPPIPAPEPTDTPAEESTTAHKDWNVMKAISIQDPDGGQSPLEGGQSEAVEGAEGKETLVRAVSMINVAAILEKANAIRQAFVGSDDESDDEEWNDS